MAIAFRPPFSEQDRAVHALNVRVCRGATCYGAVAAHFGTDSPKTLEWRIDRRRPKEGVAGDLSISNTYRRWRQGKRLPGESSIAHIYTRSAGAVDLEKWRDLMLWELLAPTPPSLDRLQVLGQRLKPLTHRRCRSPQLPRLYDYVNHERLLGLRNLHSLDAFLTLLCIARSCEHYHDESDERTVEERHLFASICAFDMFPRLLDRYRPLAYDWYRLFDCLHRVFWNRVYTYSMLWPNKASIEIVKLNLQSLQRTSTMEWEFTGPR